MFYSSMTNKSNKHTMTIQRQMALFFRIFRYQTTLNLKVTKPNQMKLGSRSQRVLGPKYWNNLPAHIKTQKILFACKQMIKAWNCISCKCNICNSVK